MVEIAEDERELISSATLSNEPILVAERAIV
eukprot:CAMPEP_0170475804 /NCGR_PEP_ID=MMETSP0123-20130129/17389_1 /TAXON_ID=182087 /ORGANISM="Favella ehrenbergii, Strain Fehren 1" /LENGTH=30 /DNA_ID= /DNA_START= /DNA_END= /DNA_ORIENTATION=